MMSLVEHAECARDDRVTISEFDFCNRLIEKRIEGVNGTLHFLESYRYDALGNQTAVETCDGTTLTRYNTRKEPIEQVDALGNSTTISYNRKGSLIKTTTSSKKVQTIETHDVRGRLVDLQVKDWNGLLIQHSEYFYDRVGNRIRSKDDILNRGKVESAIQNEWSYDSCKRITKLVENRKKETVYSYDKYGRVQKITKPNKRAIYHEYDETSRLSRYWGDGFDYTYEYDVKDRVVSVSDKKESNTIAYDIYDNVIEETLANGVVIKNEYDAYSKRRSMTLPDGSSASYEYNAGILQTVSYKDFTHTYTKRNLAGRPIEMSLPLGVFSIEWDSMSRWSRVSSLLFLRTIPTTSMAI